MVQAQCRSTRIQDPSSARHRPPAQDDPKRLATGELALAVADGQLRVVGEDRAGADEDGPGRGPAGVDVGPGRLARDPPAGAVGRRAAPVEGGGELPRDEGAAGAHRERPVAVEHGALGRQDAALDLDACCVQVAGAPRGQRVRVGGPDDDAGDTGLEKSSRAGQGPATVVARLEGDDGGAATGRRSGCGERVDLGMNGAGAAVVALTDNRARLVEDDAAHARVRVGQGAQGGQRQGTAHRRDLVAGGHRLSLSPRAAWCRHGLRDAAGGAGISRPSSPAGRRLDASPAVRAASHPDFHRRSWSSTRSTGRWLRSGRGLSPPVRTCTDPGARTCSVLSMHQRGPGRSGRVTGTAQGSVGELDDDRCVVGRRLALALLAVDHRALDPCRQRW